MIIADAYTNINCNYKKKSFSTKKHCKRKHIYICAQREYNRFSFQLKLEAYLNLKYKSLLPKFLDSIFAWRLHSHLFYIVTIKFQLTNVNGNIIMQVEEKI